MDLRDYQIKSVNDVRKSYSTGHRAPLLVLPTGAGKTYTFSYITKNANAKGNRVLILVHRQELLTQTSMALDNLGVRHGIIAPRRYGELESVGVASIQTLDRRLAQTAMHYDLIVIDEAHHGVAGTWRRTLSHFPTSKILGVTATPIRTSGEGLGVEAGGIFDDLIVGPTISELISQGHLVQPETYAPPTEIDLTGVRRKGGDYNASQAAERVDKPSVTGSAVEHYRKLSHGEPAIAFCASIDHATHVRDEFRAAGYASEVIHGKLDDDERKDLISGLATGRIQVLTSVDIISEGTDIPVVSTAILLRPTQSLGLYMQQVGRVLRPSASKRRALILDHVGNCLKHGLVTDNHDWMLDGEVKSRRKSSDDETIVRQCKKCFAVYDEGLVCPYCGHQNPPKPRKIEERDGELMQVTKEQIAAIKAQKMDEYKNAKTWQEACAIANRRGDSMYWLKMRWGRKFGQL